MLVVADESPEGLRFVDPYSATELGTLALPARVVALAMDANGVNAYVLTSNDRLHVVVIATRSLVATFNLGGNPRALLLRENAGQVVEVLVAQKGPYRVTGVNPATGATLRLVALDSDPAMLAWGMGATRVLAGARSGKLYTLDASNLAILTTAQIGDEIRDLTWGSRRPCGGGAQRADGVSLINVAYRPGDGILRARRRPSAPRWTPCSSGCFITTQDRLQRGPLISRRASWKAGMSCRRRRREPLRPRVRKFLVSQRGDRKPLRLDPDQAEPYLDYHAEQTAARYRCQQRDARGGRGRRQGGRADARQAADHAAATVALPRARGPRARHRRSTSRVVGLKDKQVRFVDLAPAGGPVLLPDTVTLTDEPDALAVDATRNLRRRSTPTRSARSTSSATRRARSCPHSR